MFVLWSLLSAAGCCALGDAAPAGDVRASASSYALLPPSCDSQIYCQGDLLRVVQNAHLYTDSKTFIDKKLLQSPAENPAQRHWSSRSHCHGVVLSPPPPYWPNNSRVRTVGTKRHVDWSISRHSVPPLQLKGHSPSRTFYRVPGRPLKLEAIPVACASSEGSCLLRAGSCVFLEARG
ncbi:Trehalase [Gryllus bimaculatus]|nr:Trehalase [Gryllus bimaculatus]